MVAPETDSASVFFFSEVHAIHAVISMIRMNGRMCPKVMYNHVVEKYNFDADHLLNPHEIIGSMAGRIW